MTAEMKIEDLFTGAFAHAPWPYAAPIPSALGILQCCEICERGTLVDAGGVTDLSKDDVRENDMDEEWCAHIGSMMSDSLRLVAMRYVSPLSVNGSGRNCRPNIVEKLGVLDVR